jgi:hypothetical protein
VPTNPKEGRDPFFPESTRMAEVPVAATQTASVTSLKVPGISGRPGHMLAMINNHTFAVGEEGEVVTDSGRLTVRCLDIQADSVLVQVNGQVHRIKIDSQ